MTTPPHFGAGRFEVRGTLGAGGAGTVYRVFDQVMQREVALKLLRTASGRDLFRFKREFRALADIVHPNLIALHELHALDGTWFFTMELVEGSSFIDWVRPSRTGHEGPARTRADIQSSPPSEVRLRGSLIQLVDALLALHRAGKLHRDLKPSNVLVTRQGRLALLDFGLVASVAENNPDKLAVGTPVYMSPEQASDRSLTEASDWYGVGAMLYEALTGRRPFEGEPEEVMTRKQTELPPEPTRAPADLAALCMQLLVPVAAARPDGLAVLGHLGAVPSQRTRDIQHSSQPHAFVGRARELTELGRAFTDSRTHGVTVLLRGASGIGKTTLVRAFVTGLAEHVFVLEGRCFEREQVPFKMLDGIVDMLTGVIVALPPAAIDSLVPKDVAALVRLFPVMRRVKRLTELAEAQAVPADPGELRRRGFYALRSLMVRLARQRPLVIFVDDAHWGDADSLAFFTELVHAPDPATLVIVAHRPEDYRGVIAKLKAPSGRRGDVRELELGALDEADAIALVEKVSAHAARTAAVVRAGGGHPLVLTEMASSPALVPGASSDAAPSIAELVRARVDRVSPEAQAMLAVSSIAARPLAIAVAAHAAGVVGGHDEAGELAAERLVTLRRIDGHMILQPAHDHVRDAVLAGLDHEARAGWHEALARSFEELQGVGLHGEAELDAQAVVEHWLAAGHPANAAHHAVAAGQIAEEALAFRRAAELYEIALAYGPWDAAGQRDLLRKKANALVCAGLLDDAAAVYAHAAELLDDAEAVDLKRLHLEALLRRGRLDEAVPVAAQLLAHIGVRSPLAKISSKTRLAAQWFSQRLRGLEFTERAPEACKPADLLRIDVLYSIVSGLAFADPALGRTLQAELLRAALECGEPVRVCLALAQEVSYASGAGSRNASAVDAVGAKLDALAQRIGHANLVGLARAARGIAAFRNGRWREAQGFLETGLAILREHGAGGRWEIDVAESYWLQTLFYLGEWRELARQGQLLLREAIERGDVVAQLGIRSGTCNLMWLLAGRAAESQAQLAAAVAALAPGYALPNVLATVAACNIALYRDEPAEAAAVLATAWPEIEKLGVLRFQHFRIELLHLRARIALSDRTRVDRVSAGLAASEELIKEGAPWAVGLGLLVHGAAQALRGSTATAIAAFLAAEEQLTDMAGWLQLARVRRGQVEGTQAGHVRAAAALDALRDLGVADPERLVDVLVPWQP